MYDAIVVGLGAMGSATLFELAKRGKKVLGIEKFCSPHSNGSTHGESRIIRQAYFEGENYVPLVLRAYELWHELEREAGERLLTPTGGLFFGKEDSTIVAGSIRTAKARGLKHEVLDAAEIMRRFPCFQLPPDFVGLYESAAGVLNPEQCVSLLRSFAVRRGAEIRDNQAVLDWNDCGDGVEVRTDVGTIRAKSLVLTPGAWISELSKGLSLPLEVRRLTMFWFAPTSGVELFQPERFPIYICDDPPQRDFYGFPAMNGETGGAKIAFHLVSRAAEPDCVDRNVAQEEVEEMRETVRRFLPTLNGPLLRTATCLYTNTPDRKFIIDRHPLSKRVTVASCCSGHGFKFASAIGETLAHLALDTPPPVDVSGFCLDRF